VKVAIEEIARFVKEGWPTPVKDWYMDDCNESVWEQAFADDDYTPREPGAIVRLEDFEAVLLYQGTDQDPGSRSFVALFKKWKRSLTTVTLLVEVPVEKAETLRAFIKAHEGKVLN
jgi:hypothetical protein